MIRMEIALILILAFVAESISRRGGDRLRYIRHFRYF